MGKEEAAAPMRAIFHSSYGAPTHLLVYAHDGALSQEQWVRDVVAEDGDADVGMQEPPPAAAAAAGAAARSTRNRHATLRTVIASREGTRQGDVLGGAGFALGVQPLYVDVQDTSGAVLTAIQDDCTAVGDISQVVSALHRFDTLLKERGDLKLNLAKTRLLLPYHTTHSIATLQPSLLAKIREVEAMGVQVVVGGMPLLGGYIYGPTGRAGAVAFAKKRLSELYGERGLFRCLLSRAMPGQIAACLLRMSGQHRAGYLCRVLPPDVLHDALVQYDQMVVETYALKLGLSIPAATRAEYVAKYGQENVDAKFPPVLSPVTLDRIQSPIADGGMGIIPSHRSAYAAFLAAHAAAVPLLDAQGIVLPAATPLFVALTDCLTHVHALGVAVCPRLPRTYPEFARTLLPALVPASPAPVPSASLPNGTHA
jgi:hypothetical protein